MVTIEKIQPHLFSNLYESFLIDDDPYSGEAEWRTVFDYQFEHDQDHCGYAMLDDGQLVGMLGMIFSERFIAGQWKKFCNLHTWWVREDHRGRSLALLRPLTRLRDYTITHFTPCDTVRAVTKRLGFTTLNSQLKVLLPSLGFSRRYAADESVLCDDPQEIEECLEPHDQRIFRDHQPYRCGYLLVRDRDRYCYLLYTHVVRHRLPYCHIHYISDKAIFVDKNRMIRAALLRTHPTARFVAVDARVAGRARLPFSFNFWAPAHAVYKSADVRPEQVDNLYSDVVFLKLTTLPDISHELRQWVYRRWPFRKRIASDG